MSCGFEYGLCVLVWALCFYHLVVVGVLAIEMEPGTT